MLTRYVRSSVTRYNPETFAYQANILANSGTISGASLAAVDNFVTACKAPGIWTKLLDVGVFAGNNLAAALTKLISASASPYFGNYNFVSGDYTEQGASGGLAGDGLTKYLDTGVHSLAIASIAFYSRTATTPSGAVTMAGTDISLAQLSTGNMDEFVYGSLTLSGANAHSKGLYVGANASITFGSYLTGFYVNGVSLASSNATVFPLANTNNEYVFAGNNSGTAYQLWAGTCAFYAVGAQLQPADVANLYAAVQALQTALNRNV